MSTKTGMSFETVALFRGSYVIKFITSFFKTVSKEKIFVAEVFVHLLTAFFKFKIHTDLGLYNICEILVKTVGNFSVVIESFIFPC